VPFFREIVKTEGALALYNGLSAGFTRQANSHGARPVHLIITMIKWIRTSRLPIKNSLLDRKRVYSRYRS